MVGGQNELTTASQLAFFFGVGGCTRLSCHTTSSSGLNLTKDQLEKSNERLEGDLRDTPITTKSALERY